MKTEITPEYQHFLSQFKNPQLFFRMWVILAGLEIGALFFLGFAFFLLVHGFIFGVAWFAMYWKPAYIIFTKALNINGTTFQRAPIPWWRVIILGIKAFLILCFFYFGLKFLFTSGFLGQNLIYLFLFRK